MTRPLRTKRPSSARDLLAKTKYESGELRTVADVAAFLGLSKAAARIRLHRAGTNMRPRGHQRGMPWRKAA